MEYVYKIDLLKIFRQDIEIPVTAQILSVQDQYGKPKLWFRCDPDYPKQKRTIMLAETGEKLKREPGEYLEHISTV